MSGEKKATTRTSVVVDSERPFNVEEMFFSRTDHRGVIEYGNEVFTRISGHDASTLVGSPHNIIRHPDMPRAVFKLFWSYLLEKRPIVAYVKNRAADGTYYWVIASVFPSDGGFVSVRIKPTSKLCTSIAKIYAELGGIEAQQSGTKGIEQASSRLMEVLQSMGYSSYDRFMADALLAEIESRDNALKNHQSADLQQSLKSHSSSIEINSSVTDNVARGAARLRSTFSKLAVLAAMNETFQKETTAIFDACHQLKYDALNMAVASAKSGDTASGLVIIAREFQTTSEITRESLEKFSSASDLSTSILSTRLALAYVRTQMDMIDYFIKFEPNRSEVPRAANNLLTLAQSHLKSAAAELEQLKGKLKSLLSMTVDLSKNYRALRVLCNAGRIEASRLHGMADSFSTQLEALGVFVASASDSTLKIDRDSKRLIETVNDLARTISGVMSELAEAQIELKRITSRQTEKISENAKNQHLSA